jgi:hypothetical protein
MVCNRPRKMILLRRKKCLKNHKDFNTSGEICWYFFDAFTEEKFMIRMLMAMLYFLSKSIL